MGKIQVDASRCIGCGICVKDCVAGILHVEDGKVQAGEVGCIACGHCFAVCPKEAITVEGVEPDSGEVVSMTEFDSGHLLKAMKSRRTIRQFTKEPISQEMLEMILEAGRYCPTGSNSQAISYTILGSRQDEVESICVNLFRKGLAAAGFISDFVKNMQVDDHFFFKGAPLVIVVSGKSSTDAALASSYMELMAESLGLGVLYSGFFIACTRLSSRIKPLLDLPKGHKPVTCMVIGHPAVKYHRIPGRKPANVKIL